MPRTSYYYQDECKALAGVFAFLAVAVWMGGGDAAPSHFVAATGKFMLGLAGWALLHGFANPKTSWLPTLVFGLFILPDLLEALRPFGPSWNSNVMTGFVVILFALTVYEWFAQWQWGS